MHISITGDLGSGKSSVAKLLCGKLGYKFISTGVIQRKLGLEKGMNTLEFNKYTDDNKEVDDYIDQHLKDINEGNVSYILDSRLAWFFVNKSFKVYLLAFSQVAAQRILDDNNRIGEPNAADVERKIKDSDERRNIENNRFEKSYGAKFDLFDNFDLIIDTSFSSIEEVAEKILNAYEKWNHKLSFIKIWFSTKRLFPLENIRVIGTNAAKEIRKNIEQEGFNIDFPISILALNQFYFIFDGHKRFSASLYSNLSLIPVDLIAREKEETIKGLTAENYIIDCFKMSIIYDWEDAHSFSYLEYPKFD